MSCPFHSPADLAQLNLASPEVLRDPYAVYARLRADGGVTWNERYRAWLVSKHEYVRSLLTHPNVSVEKIAPFAAHMAPEVRSRIDAMQDVMKDWVVFNDPPRHTRLRKAIQRGFMPRTLNLLEPKIREVTRSLLDELAGRESVEFLSEFAYRLPAFMICDLFGIPREDARSVHSWAMDMTKFILGSPDEDRYDVSATAMLKMRDYFSAKVAARKRLPATDDDLVDLLIASQQMCEEGLSDDEIVASLVLIVFGGFETTANMIGNAMKVLIDHKEQLRALQADPSRIPAALEELMRFDGPAPVVTRVAKADIAVGDKTIQAGQRIFLVLHAANHDETVFPDPEALDFGRGRPLHVQFSGGMHACPGATLARLEGRIAFEELLARFSDFELADGEFAWRNSLMTRGPSRLLIRMIPAKATA